MPGISVIVPVYQAEKFLKDCVESVVRQSYSDWELLLIDDGCTDRSPAICDACAAEDSRVRVFHKAKNAGVSGGTEYRPAGGPGTVYCIFGCRRPV